MTGLVANDTNGPPNAADDREQLELDIISPVRASVFFSGPPPGPSLAPFLRHLDQAGIRVVSDVDDMDGDPPRVRRIIGGCGGLITMISLEHLHDIRESGTDPVIVETDNTDRPHLVLVEKGLSFDTNCHDNKATVSIDKSTFFHTTRTSLHGPHEFELESSELDAGTRALVDSFVARVCEIPVAEAFAFMIGRLERDFAHAREAIRAAVELEAGIPCLWSDDGRHRIKTKSVRLTTQLLLQHAEFVIADLTLGPENPENENPSRAHEIGISVAHHRPLMLCSREPRRYPYFSIGDLQMFFWSDERDLYERATEWLRAERASIGRTVLNNRLREWLPGYHPVVKPVEFAFDAKRRYLWPLTRPYSDLEILAMSASIGGIALSAALTTDLGDRLGPAIYPVAGLTVAVALVALPRWSSRLRASLGQIASLVPVALVISALAFATLALIE